MEQPEGFKVKGKENLVCQLKKSLYGLKQALRQWYKKFDSFIIDHGCRRTNSDHCVFVKRFDDGEFIILLLYVDDMLIVGQNSEKISKLKADMKKHYAMKDLGSAKHILGMSIRRGRKEHKAVAITRKVYREGVGAVSHGNGKASCYSTCYSLLS
jgi:ATP-binding cassette subfamily B (MDR/TAP) protein 1